MPLYQVEHSDPLTRAEMDELATKITDIHKTAYGTPTPFIGVVFEDISKTNFYEGGVQV
jgi:phenylpyruvate tautomerase PptA (4-oxalocrotonate tautomerase family)